jgi:hypothetical protein
MMAMGFWQLRWFRRLVIWGLVPLALGYAIFEINYPTCTFRYKLTAEVMTPDGLKTGSSVIELSFSHFGDLVPLSECSRSDWVTGEAVYVDLGKGKNLFVLLGADHWDRKASRTPGCRGGFDGVVGGNDATDEEQIGEGSLDVKWLPIHIYKIGSKPGEEREMTRRINMHRGAPPVDVPMVNLPLIGTFVDINRPETFNTVLPTSVAEVFGEGFALKRVSMQIVNDETGDNMRKIFPWLSSNSSMAIEKKCNGKIVSESKGPCRARSGNFKLHQEPY